ncbi:MAG: hypothetical protein E7667_00915 [Ruminococcaceae bacterium]|nr:hypothetical protein [Oscillospiraceae bacterium]
MKKIIKISIVLVMLLLSIFVITSCSRKDAYSDITDKGYTVSVKFDIGDGMFEGRNDLVLVDVFNLSKEKSDDSGNKVIKILDPNSTLRGDEAFEYNYSGHYFVGWYQERYPLEDEQGNMLDEYGNITTDPEQQAYYYQKKWDFEKDRLSVDPSKEYSPEEPCLTLYAAWVPLTKFEIYAPNESGEFELLDIPDNDEDCIKASALNIPQWDKQSGELISVGFPTIDNKTFNKAYSSPECTDEYEITSSTVLGHIDEEKGILISDTVKIYTTWLDGTWYKIYNAGVLANKTDENANYEICANLDFSSIRWSDTMFASKTFNGTLCSEEGSNYKLSGIFVRATGVEDATGIFHSLGENSVIKNITFENTALSVSGLTKDNILNLGLIASLKPDGAVFENVEFSGTNVITIDTAGINAIKKHSVGLVFGSGDCSNIAMNNIDCVPVDENAPVKIIVDYETGTVRFIQP